MEIDQQSAIQLLEQCATLIIAGVPDKTEFGIDLYSISVTEEFRGKYKQLQSFSINIMFMPF